MEEIKNKLRILKKETEDILDDLAPIEDAILQKTGSGWSLIQVLSHLNMAESGSLRYMKKKILAGEKMKKVNAWNSFRMWVTSFFLQTGLRWKAPSYIANPEGKYTLSEMKSIWNDTRAQIDEYVNSYPENLLDRAVYRHPMAGRLSLEQAVDSFIYHQRHHVHQIKRIKKELGI